MTVNIFRNVLVVLHNVHSVQRVVEMAKLCFGLGFNTLIVSKAIGTAAQSGIPEAHRLAMHMGKRLIIVPDVQDAIDLFNPDEILLFAPKPYGKEQFNPKEVCEKASMGKLIMLVYGGLEPGLSSRELSLGRAVFLAPSINIGTIGTAAISLYLIMQETIKCNSH